MLQVRDYIHVMDLATGHSKALDKLFCTPDIGNQVLHISRMSSEAAYGSSAMVNVCVPCFMRQGIEIVPQSPYIHMLRLLVAGCAVYNLGTGKGTSVLEMVEAFEKASGKVRKSHLALIVEKPVNAFTHVALDMKPSSIISKLFLCGCQDVQPCKTTSYYHVPKNHITCTYSHCKTSIFERPKLGSKISIGVIRTGQLTSFFDRKFP